MGKEATFQDFSAGSPPDGQDLWRWLYVELRAAILDGRLKAGARMPSTRSLASQYSLSRGTVVAAFDQLQSEGYTHTKVGSGTYVALEVTGRGVSIRAHRIYQVGLVNQRLAFRNGGRDILGRPM